MSDPITLPPGYTVRNPSDTAVPDAPGTITLPPGFSVRGSTPAGASAVVPEKERGLNLDLVNEAGTNFLPSLTKNVGQMIEGIGNAVAHPIDTGKALGKLALTASPLAEPAMNFLVKKLSPHLDDEQKKKLAAQLGDLYGPKHALVEDYVNAYGDKDKLLKTIATDPVRVMSDLATIATGGELAAARAPGMAGRVARGVSRAAQNLDPLTATGNLAVGAARRVPGFLDSATNVGEGPMAEALRSGRRGGQAGDDFLAAMRQGIPTQDVVDLAKDKVTSMKRDMYAEYNREKANWAALPATPLGFDRVNAAELQVANMISSQPGSTLRMKVSGTDQTRINRLMEITDEWRRDPTSWTIEGLDDLKQRLRNEIDWKADKPVFQRAATTLVNGVREQLLQNAPPSYRRAMRAYTDASREIDNIDQALSLGKNAALQTSMSKLQSVMRNNANTQYGLRGQLLDRMEQQGGRELRPILAGHALSSEGPRGIARGVISGGLPSLLAGVGGAGHAALTGMATLNPATIAAAGLGYGAGRLLTSPRTMGSAMYDAGAVARPFARVWDRMGEGARSMFRGAASQPARNAIGAFDRTQNPDPFEGYARGGYFAGRG